MNLTLAIDQRVLERARAAADAMGKSLNQLIREYLEQLAGDRSADDDLAELNRLSSEAQGRSKAWHLDREPLHERR